MTIIHPRIYYDCHDLIKYFKDISLDDIAKATGAEGEISNGELIYIYVEKNDKDDEACKLTLRIREIVGDNPIHYWW